MSTLEQEIRELVDDIREGRTTSGTIALTGWAGPTSEDQITVGLARFQSYRARTEAALVQEIADLVDENHAQYLTYRVVAESGVVDLEV